jgi:transcriptional regulator with GAF, ATPase, and Fis domain
MAEHSHEGSPEDPQARLLEDVIGIIPSLYASADLDDTFARIAEAAVAVLDACDYASIVTTGRELHTRAATDEVARTADEMQYQEGQGPCLDAVSREQWVMTPDVQADSRWPRLSARLAGELQVHSMLSVRLAVAASPSRNLGGLNMYSRRPGAFDRQQRDLGLLLAAVASVAADASRTNAQLAEAIRTRQVIGEAVGIIRAQSGMSSEEAFRVLIQASQRMNVKLRDVACTIANDDQGRLSGLVAHGEAVDHEQ